MQLINLENSCWICIEKLNTYAPINSHTVYEQIKRDLFQKELQFHGKKIMMPRLTAWYGEKEYNYSGTINKPVSMPPEVYKLARWLEATYGHLPGIKWRGKTFNSVLCNYYRDGNDSVDWHSDDEHGLGPAATNVLIASVTFGDSRKFVLKNKQTKQKLSFDLGNGDVLFMGGQTQKFWVHKIPKTSKKVGTRLNLTYRVML